MFKLFQLFFEFVLQVEVEICKKFFEGLQVEFEVIIEVSIELRQFGLVVIIMVLGDGSLVFGIL